MKAVAVELDALGDTRPLWRAWLADAARRYRSIEPLEPGSLPEDRAAAAARLDAWAAKGIGNWRSALARFAEDHAPLTLRPEAEATAALRAFERSGVRVGVFTDAPEELARVVLAHVGASRRVETLVAGEDALARLLGELGRDAHVVRSRDELARLAI